jgi:ribonuclease R
LFVELDETGADGLIPARLIGDEYFHFDEKGRAFTDRSATYRLGDPVTVDLVEAALSGYQPKFNEGFIQQTSLNFSF